MDSTSSQIVESNFVVRCRTRWPSDFNISMQHRSVSPGTYEATKIQERTDLFALQRSVILHLSIQLLG